MNAIDGFLRAAVAALPVEEGLVLLDSFEEHNPDFFDQVVELFGAEEAKHVRAEVRLGSKRSSALRALEVEGVRVLGGASFDAEYARPSNRVAIAMAPILARDGRAGLLVVQIQTTKRRRTLADDHWVLLRKDAVGSWKRAPIPAPIREVLHLTEETGG